jgi:hypothetical protein
MKKIAFILLAVICMSFTKRHRTHINGHRVVIIETCYKYHEVTHVRNRMATKSDPYTTVIETERICDSASYDTIYKH